MSPVSADAMSSSPKKTEIKNLWDSEGREAVSPQHLDTRTSGFACLKANFEPHDQFKTGWQWHFVDLNFKFACTSGKILLGVIATYLHRG